MVSLTGPFIVTDAELVVPVHDPEPEQSMSGRCSRMRERLMLMVCPESYQ
jgi:hypothetical protein